MNLTISNLCALWKSERVSAIKLFATRATRALLLPDCTDKSFGRFHGVFCCFLRVLECVCVCVCMTRRFDDRTIFSKVESWEGTETGHSGCQTRFARIIQRTEWTASFFWRDSESKHNLIPDHMRVFKELVQSSHSRQTNRALLVPPRTTF
jgi:hypothetical protein